MSIAFTDEQVAFARNRVHYYANEWHGEIPTRLHTSSKSFDDSGAPAFHPEFSNYLEESLRDQRRQRSPRPGDLAYSRRRVTEAFRMLRRKAPKEYDAINCLTVIDQVGRHVDPHGAALERQFEQSLALTAQRFNVRARRRGEQRVYTRDDILLLVVSAIHKLVRWAN